ncbi:hypothetical protein RvY_04800 [Ramazzottius varieornatus]|uniref:Uncharacterized protein n=1 Tax=Ramazzottius varieornatus TaxID=947166 RepID=A0A1D1UZH2_RAMVA|nr:hypothetical protein RvY_04800 [Ramazzottius varieornatus]
MEQHPTGAAEARSEHLTRCGSCRDQENGPCVKHCPYLVPDEEFSRAICTLPSQLAFRVIQCSDAQSEITSSDDEHEGMGESRRVFARRSIPAGAVYGPLAASLGSEKRKRCSSQFGVVVDGNVRDYCLDSDMMCNWMKYVRLADTPTEANLMAYQHGNSVYFSVVNGLSAGVELCVGYSRAYATSMGKVTSDADGDVDGLSDSDTDVSLPPFASKTVLEPRKKEVAKRKRKVADGPPEVHQEADKSSNKKKRSIPKSKAEKDEHSDEKLYSEDEEPRKGKRQRKPKQQEENVRVTKREKPLLEVEKLTQNFKLPSASKLLAANRWYKYPCPEEDCTADFRLPGLLAIHATKHGAEIPQDLKEPGPKSCPGCETRFPDATVLVRHIAEHERHYRRLRKISCDQCGKKFRSEESLVVHKQQLHSGEVIREFSCKQCQKKFLTFAALRSHENFHKEKGFVCPVCTQMFSGSMLLNVHSEVHRVDGKFPCRVCLKVYDSWLILSRHMKQTHLKVREFKKTYPCSTCKKSCRGKAELARHMGVHSVAPTAESFSCDDCGRKFRQKAALSNHQPKCRTKLMKERLEKFSKTIANSFTCIYCNREYSSQERLAEHQMIKHGC